MEHKRTYSDKLEEAINKALADFCKKAKIDEKVFKKSLSYYISDDNPDVLSLKPVLLEALK